MILPLGDDLRITSNEHCYQLEKRRPKGDWRPFKYHTSLAAACQAALEREFRLHPAKGIAEVLEVARRLSLKYGKLIDDALKVAS